MQATTMWVGLALAAVADAAPLAVSIDFPNGSAAVEQIDQATRTIRLQPSPHAERGWACWWHFKLSGVTPGETITLDVGEDGYAKPDRAYYSVDGRQWQPTGPGERQGKRIVYRQPIHADEAWFAVMPPFVVSDAQRLVTEAAAASPHATAFVLCTSDEGREVPALRVAEVGNADAAPYGIWLQARQHAWEAGSSWVAQGFIDWLLSDDDTARRLRRQSVITLVPIMDVDNVERGAGGKGQLPQDHNRDWSDAPAWRSVSAAQQAIQQAHQAGQFDLFVDLHNPSPGDKLPMFFLPYGKTSEAGPERSGALWQRWRYNAKNWIVTNTGDHVVAVTLETSWNTPHSTIEGYKLVGANLGRTIERYLRSDVRQAQGD